MAAVFFVAVFGAAAPDLATPELAPVLAGLVLTALVFTALIFTALVLAALARAAPARAFGGADLAVADLGAADVFAAARVSLALEELRAALARAPVLGALAFALDVSVLDTLACAAPVFVRRPEPALLVPTALVPALALFGDAPELSVLAVEARFAAVFLLLSAAAGAARSDRERAGFVRMAPAPRVLLEAGVFRPLAVFLLEGIRGYSFSLSRCGDGTEATPAIGRRHAPGLHGAMDRAQIG